MIKVTAVLFVCGATLAACAHPEPAQTAQAGTGTQTPPYSGHPGSTIGATEQMPEPAASSKAAPAAAPATVAQPTSAPAQAAEPWTDGRILQFLHSADQGEVAQAQLARTRATEGRVKRFAAMLINDHTVADEEAQSTARRTGTSFEASPASRNIETDTRGSTDGLKGQAGAEFDRAYIGTQIAEDQALLGTIDDDLTPHAQSADVKMLLTRVRGKVLMHLQRAQDIFAALNK
jgi:putative membrane protein